MAATPSMPCAALVTEVLQSGKTMLFTEGTIKFHNSAHGFEFIEYILTARYLNNESQSIEASELCGYGFEILFFLQ
jgi:hypothetical protein